MTPKLIDALREGKAGVIATDTVIGLAACPGSRGYVDIFDLKQRPGDQALPWLVNGADAIGLLTREAPGYAHRLATMFWPGALTLVLKASTTAAEMGEIAPDGTIALRCPDDEGILALMDELGGPLCCTSANLHGKPAAVSPADLPESMRALPGGDALGNAHPSGLASTIVDCTGPYPKILREGPIPEQVLLDVACFGATLTT